MQYIFTTFAHSATLSSFFQRHLTIEQFLASIGFALPGKIANNSPGRRKKKPSAPANVKRFWEGAEITDSEQN